jgi:hypothetical protein
MKTVDQLRLFFSSGIEISDEDQRDFLFHPARGKLRRPRLKHTILASIARNQCQKRLIILE